MYTPVRIQRSRKEKQQSPNLLPIVYCGRPTKWGNPFKVSGEPGHWFVLNSSNEPLYSFDEKNQAIDECINLYEDYIKNEISLKILNVLDLKNKNLSCWCKLECKCHTDVLLKLANK